MTGKVLDDSLVPLSVGREQSSLLFDEQVIEKAVADVAENLNRHCASEPWVLICVLNGGLVFCGHLLPLLRFELVLDYVRVSRYGKDTHGGALEWRAQQETSLAGKNVLLIDDIFDEGATLKAIALYCQAQGASQVRSAVLVNKQHDRKVPGFHPDHVGLECPDKYVFGFGMDLHGGYRNLPAIHVLAGDQGVAD